MKSHDPLADQLAATLPYPTLVYLASGPSGLSAEKRHSVRLAAMMQARPDGHVTVDHEEQVQAMLESMPDDMLTAHIRQFRRGPLVSAMQDALSRRAFETQMAPGLAITEALGDQVYSRGGPDPSSGVEV